MTGALQVISTIVHKPYMSLAFFGTSFHVSPILNSLPLFPCQDVHGLYFDGFLVSRVLDYTNPKATLISSSNLVHSRRVYHISLLVWTLSNLLLVLIPRSLLCRNGCPEAMRHRRGPAHCMCILRCTPAQGSCRIS